MAEWLSVEMRWLGEGVAFRLRMVVVVVGQVAVVTAATV